MKRLKIVTLTFVLFAIYFFFAVIVFAEDFNSKNNKFGIHLAQPHLEDLQKAHDLVNSSGGDWGYITLVIQEDDRNKDKWQDIFNRLRKLHLIPIVRIATKPEGAYWKRPSREDADSWVEFLNSLNWVIKHRYIILFNEPNHAAEWGGAVDPKSYAEIALEFAKKLKEKNSDFFVLLAGFDASAPHRIPQYYDEALFLQEFFTDVSADQFKTLFAGWTSHSYPNPGFAGSPGAFGRGTIRTYQWELELLSSFGINDLPVFITETGWDRGALGENLTASNLRTSFENVWLPDARVIAVTPFVLDYQGDPFLGFSWKLPSARASEGNEFYLQYYTVQSIVKEKGDPEQIEKGLISIDLPKELVAQSSYRFSIQLKNEGQSVWDKDDGYKLSIRENGNANFEYFFSDLKNIAPFESSEAYLYLKTGKIIGTNSLEITLNKEGREILQTAKQNFTVSPLPRLNVKAILFPKFTTSAKDFELQIFDEKETLVFKKTRIQIVSGKGLIEDIQNIVFGKKYRIVLLKQYYLPRQEHFVFTKGTNVSEFQPMFPVDFNKDGKLDGKDLFELFRHPSLISLVLP